MNITMLGSFPPLRGISSYCVSLAEAVAEKAHVVEFLSFKSMYPAFLYPGGNLEDDRTFPPSTNPFLRVKRKLAWYNPVGWIFEGRRNTGEILHAQWWSLPLAPVYLCICLFFKLRKIPIVFTVHNVASHEQSIFFHMASRLLFTMGDHFIVHSTQNQEQLTDLYAIPASAISLIPHGPLNFETPAGVDKKTLRAELGIPPENQVILIFGAIRPYKGIETAIAAFSQVVQKIPHATLLIVGKPWGSLAPYETLIEDHGLKNHIRIVPGYVPANQVYRYFHATDLVLLPYHHFDSQSGVGGAALAFKKPLIVSQVGGLPELVQDPEAVVPPKNADALAHAIIACLDDPARLQKMAGDARIVAKKLSWDYIAQRTIAVYQNLSASLPRT